MYFVIVILFAGLFCCAVIVLAGQRKSPVGQQLPPSSGPNPVSVPAALSGITIAEDGEMLLSDEKFAALVAQALGDRVEHSFHTTIAGTSHRNDDGTSRTAAIKKCEAMTPLFFVHDEGNQFSRHAMAVMTDEGDQLG